MQEGNSLKIQPVTIGSVEASYISKPLDVRWGFIPNTNLGIFVYNDNDKQDFELHSSEQTEVILRVLAYAGIVIRDPQIVQAATAQVQQQNINEKR